MKITRIETITVGEFFHVCWVRIHTDAGHIGLGETWYIPRAVEAVIHDVYSPHLIGQNPIDRERLWAKMFGIAEGFGYAGAEFRALSAIDIALWDIAGQSMGEPIYNLLGGMSRDKIRIYNTIGSYGEYQDNEWELKDPVGLAQSYIDEGITMFKSYYSMAIPRDDQGNFVAAKDIRKALQPLEKIRNAVGDQIEIAHDGGGQWSLPAAIRICQAMEEYDIFWQEEMIRPVNVEAHLRLKEATKTPITAAERLFSKFQFREFIEKGAAEIVMPDLIWTGGITETKKIATLAETYQTPITPHDWTGPVNVFACAHISISVPNLLMQETNRAYYKGWYDKFVEPNIVVRDGYLMPPEGPGLGTRLKADVFDRPDVRVQTSDESYEFNWPGFIDPGQTIGNVWTDAPE
jgi:galactonate dehydratase